MVTVNRGRTLAASSTICKLSVFHNHMVREFIQVLMEVASILRETCGVAKRGCENEGVGTAFPGPFNLESMRSTAGCGGVLGTFAIDDTRPVPLLLAIESLIDFNETVSLHSQHHRHFLRCVKHRCNSSAAVWSSSDTLCLSNTRLYRLWQRHCINTKTFAILYHH